MTRENGKIYCILQDREVFKYQGAPAEIKNDEYTIYDFNGRELEKCDAYGVKTENYYDEYGNLTKTVVSARGTTETITNEYVYDADKEAVTGSLDKEAVTGSKDGLSGDNPNSNIIYNNYCRNIDTVSEPSLSGLAANSTEYS